MKAYFHTMPFPVRSATHHVIGLTEEVPPRNVVNPCDLRRLVVQSLLSAALANESEFGQDGIQARTALVGTPFVDSTTSRCGACSPSNFFCRNCLFSRSCCIWFLVTRRAGSSCLCLLVFLKYPPTNPAIITFLNDGLVGLVIFAKLTGIN